MRDKPVEGGGKERSRGVPSTLFSAHFFPHRQRVAIPRAEYLVPGCICSVGVVCCCLHLLHILLGHSHGLESLP